MMRIKFSKSVLCFVFFFSVGFFIMEMATAQNTTIPVKVGVVLYDFDDWVGKMLLNCINMSLLDFYENNGHYKTRLALHTRDTNGDVGAAAAAVDLIKNVQVQAIIGASTSMEANFITELGEKAQVPIISFSGSSPSRSSLKNPYLFRATQNVKTQVNTISAIIQSFGWKEAVPIYIDNEYGVGIISNLVNALQVVGTRVPHLSAISPLASDDQILEELYKLKTMRTRVFIVHMIPSLGSRIFTKANEIGMTSEYYSWILTDGMTNLLSSIDHSVFNSISGRVLGVKPYVQNTKELENFHDRWKENHHQGMLNIYGLWAYDATMALAMAIEKVASTASFRFETTEFSCNSMDLETFGVSQNGPKLVEALSNTSFKGLTGDFIFVNQQLQSSYYQIVNVNDVGLTESGGLQIQAGGFHLLHGPRIGEIGGSHNTWDPLVSLMWSTRPEFSENEIWPAASSTPTVESTSVSKRLRIGVPRGGFNEFVKVKIDAKTNATICSGYSIDVFEAAMKELSHPPSYEYIPFNGTFDELVFQVYVGNFDGVIGDVTITETRSLYVDFTLPYMEHGGVSIIVPIEDHKSSRTWVLVKPLTWRLWVASICLYGFITFAVWVLEHGKDRELQGSPSPQTGTRFFSSGRVFAHKEKVVRNLAKTTVIIWCILGFVLTQSYGAALSSFLTVQQLQPTVNYVTELIQKREKVGYQNGSFVLGILQGLGFHDSQILSCFSPEECQQLLLKGSKNGGIAAAFDEIPYINLILAQSCSRYTLVQPILDIQQFKTNGFGFVFPKGSFLAVEVSSAILKLKERHQMKKMEEKWFGKPKHCSLRGSDVSVSNKLDLDSFQGLFVIAGVIPFIAVVIYVAILVHEYHQILMPPYSSASLWSIVQDLLRIVCPKSSNSNATPPPTHQGEHSPDTVYQNSDRPRQLLASDIELINSNT